MPFPSIFANIEPLFSSFSNESYNMFDSQIPFIIKPIADNSCPITTNAKSNAIIDYAGNPDGSIGTINKLVGEEYVPTLNGETNSEELLSAKVSEANEEIMVLFYNNEYVLFQVVNL